MSSEMDNLERTVEREMELLRDLPAVSPRRECVERIQAAVVAEAARVTRHRRAMRLAQAGLGVAAALVLAFGLSTMRPQHRTVGGMGPEAALDEWAMAWDESSGRVTRLLDGGWISGDFGNRGDDEGEFEDLFDSLDQSLGRFESL